MSGFLRLTAVVSILTVAASGGGTQGASAQTPTAVVTVVHGLRGVVADIYIDNTLVLPAFQPERVTDPVTRMSTWCRRGAAPASSPI